MEIAKAYGNQYLEEATELAKISRINYVIHLGQHVNDGLRKVAYHISTEGNSLTDQQLNKILTILGKK